MLTDPKPETLAVAGGAIASALLDLLIERKILTTDDARTVYHRAEDEITRLIGMKGAEAVGIIQSMTAKIR